MEEKETMIQIDNVSKVYRLGEIGGTTLRESFQRLGAKIRHKEDPTKKIGAKNYNKGEKFKALDNINLTIKKGERIGIIGHNGAGKSTLLKLICRVTAPTTGEIGLNGRVTSMLEVGTGFHPELTGRENIYMNGAILGMTKKEIDAVIEDIIDFSEVSEFIDTPVKRYSSGMYVKLAFSVAAHLKSEIMIMDEVLAVGDMAFQNKCLTKMRDVSEQQDRTILYVSHNMNTIRKLCDRVIVFSNGHIIFDGDTDDGIALYLNNEHVIFRKSIDTRQIKRPDRCNFSIRINKIEFHEKDSNIFEMGEIIKFKLNISSNGDYKNVRIRAIIRSFSDSPVATSISQPFYDFSSNFSAAFIVCLATKHFVKGKYMVTFELFQRNDDGSEVILDYLSRIVNFSITEFKNNDSLKDWDTKYWSNIKLPDLEVIK